MMPKLIQKRRRRTAQGQVAEEHSPYSTIYYGTPAQKQRDVSYFHGIQGGRIQQDGAVEYTDAAGEEEEEEEGASQADGGEDEVETPLLPLFQGHQLDAIPVYQTIQFIRNAICSRIETVLTWEQLRTPQVSSFCIKPILSSILRDKEKMSKGVVYCLMANCHQFRLEVAVTPANAGVCTTRALVAEMLAMKLLKEFTSRELIDVLSYDYHPLLSAPSDESSVGKASLPSKSPRTNASRSSAMELAIKAQAKRFLNHPAVIQHLEAIWNGRVVFHSQLDNIHRKSSDKIGKDDSRRSCTTYDPRSASWFKLSRLRVPRYKHATSTFSLAVLLLLFLLVLNEKSYEITFLEIAFWLWSLGYMLDELADFNESGVALYFMSLWNSFDVGVFLLFVMFYFLRIAGLLMPDDRNYITDWAFDILATSAILLFPRIFSVLDHYQYFSQLIIAFRVMAWDMLSLLVLIAISCSGFFIAFTFSFGGEEKSSGADILYALFQILMGFSPAAWTYWVEYNVLGKFLLAAFLIICHFLIVTILITVLTNSFSNVASNAQEEHQFLVAVNTISLVKNEALFIYVAPANLLAWAVLPLRAVLPFRKFVKLNRYIIKATHFPVLFLICTYERVRMQNKPRFEPLDEVAKGRAHTALQSRDEMLSPAIRRLRRRESYSSAQQEAALQQVFQGPIRQSRIEKDRAERRQNNNVDNWMNGVMHASPPTEIEGNSSKAQTPRGRRVPRLSSDYGTMTRIGRGIVPRDYSASRSVMSDPEDFMSASGAFRPGVFSENEPLATRTEDDDADNEDDENIDEDTDVATDALERPMRTTTAGLRGTAMPALRPSQPNRRPPLSRHHSRANSTHTVLLGHPPVRDDSSSDDDSDVDSFKLPHKSGTRTPRPLPRSRPQTAIRQRPGMPIRSQFQSVPNLNLAGFLSDHEDRRRPSSVIQDLALAGTDMMPGSLNTEIMGRGGSDGMLIQLMSARMGALEMGMRQLLDNAKDDRNRKKGKDKEG